MGLSLLLLCGFVFAPSLQPHWQLCCFLEGRFLCSFTLPSQARDVDDLRCRAFPSACLSVCLPIFLFSKYPTLHNIYQLGVRTVCRSPIAAASLTRLVFLSLSILSFLLADKYVSLFNNFLFLHSPP